MKLKLFFLIFFLSSTSIKAENHLDDWLNSKEYRFAVYMSECKIPRADGSFTNCNMFNNLRFKILMDNFELGKNFNSFE